MNLCKRLRQARDLASQWTRASSSKAHVSQHPPGEHAARMAVEAQRADMEVMLDEKRSFSGLPRERVRQVAAETVIFNGVKNMLVHANGKPFEKPRKWSYFLKDPEPWLTQMATMEKVDVKTIQRRAHKVNVHRNNALVHPCNLTALKQQVSICKDLVQLFPADVVKCGGPRWFLQRSDIIFQIGVFKEAANTTGKP